MKIKIPAQTHRNITNEAFERDVKTNSQVGNIKTFPKSDNLIGIAEYKDGTKKVYQMLSIKVGDKKYISALASPTHLFLSAAIELYQLSEIRKFENFPKCGKKLKDSDLHCLDFEPGYTHECYNDFLKARITSIIMLVSALENFMNQQIPVDFKYHTKGKKPKEYDVYAIEKKVFFKEKMEDVLPKALKQEDLWETRTEDLKVLLELYEQRKAFIHLKTKSEEEWNRYSDVFSSMLEFNILEAINTTISFMNSVNENFVEVEGN